MVLPRRVGLEPTSIPSSADEPPCPSGYTPWQPVQVAAQITKKSTHILCPGAVMVALAHEDASLKAVAQKLKGVNAFDRGDCRKCTKGPLGAFCAAFRKSKGRPLWGRPLKVVSALFQAARCGRAFHAFKAVIALRAASKVRKRMLSTL